MTDADRVGTPRRRVTAALARVTAALPTAEDRPGQRQMADAVSSAILDGHHLVVAAGTGTGKTLAYLVPAVLAGKRTIVATATKALQDQLAAKDLPFLAEHLGRPFTWEVLKGRRNYACLQRLRELADPAQGQLELDDMAGAVRSEVRRLATWAATSPTGDQAELSWSPSDRAWRAVSVGSDECPGRSRCTMGQSCFAEGAKMRAEHADVVVVNLHLYGLDVAMDGAILGEHDVVVMDEAHQVGDIISDTIAVEVSGARLANLAAVTRRIIDDPALVARITDGAGRLAEALGPLHGQRLPWPLPAAVQDALSDIRLRVAAVLTALAAITSTSDDVRQRVLRAQQVAGRTAASIDTALAGTAGFVPFVAGMPGAPSLQIAPLDVGPQLAANVWGKRTAVLTSATIPTSLRSRLGLAEATELDVGSPFDFASKAMLYCAMDLPDPRAAGFAEQSHQELAALINAAGGRTLALFTSWKAMDAAAAAVRAMVEAPIITQRDMPKGALVQAFSRDEATCLFATAGFFQGVDIPGRTLSLVVIDRIPFPRPDDPLLSARRELLGPAAFSQIDLPRAAMLLAQAAGRLIRSAQDRGVVAVLDRRLGTAGYRWDIVRALPPMRRTRHRADAEAFLREITVS